MNQKEQNTNILAIKHPKLAKEWHPTKNGDLKPTKITFGSEKKVWWQCDEGHEWKARVSNRSNGKNCPYCSGRYAIKDINDLKTTYPTIAKQWHPTKNGDLKPTDVTSFSNKKVWWQCDKGHEWKATIKNRTLGTGCPYCSGRKVFKGFNDLQTFNPTLAKEWHPTKNGGLKPTDVTSYSNKKVWWQCDKGHEWEATVSNRSGGRNCPYCSNRKTLPDFNDLATKCPKLVSEWHPTKNNNLKPTEVAFGSGKKVWWQCKHGHEWQAKIADRSGKNSGCPFCFGKKVSVGFNDLPLTHSELAKEWHPTKNGDLRPTDVTYGSAKKVWWQCDKGHEWQATISNRSVSGNGCPYCSGRMAIIGFNDLSTKNPELAKEWHPTKNGDLKPTDVTFSSNKKVWWKCNKGHEWQAKVSDRSNGTGCPYCSNKKVLINFNDLSLTHPELANEWHPTKNGDLKPTDVTYGSTKKVWWQCKRGHEWKTTISGRSRGYNCPYCSSNGTSLPEMTVLYYFKKYGDIEIKHRYKDLGFELDLYFEFNNRKIGIEYDGVRYHKDKVVKDLNKNNQCVENNITLYRIRELPLTKLNDTSIDFVCNSRRKQEFSDIISYLIKKIFGKSVVIDIDKDSNEINTLIDTLEKENSLVKTHPELAKEWHSIKNGNLKPTDVTYGSTKKVWWQCDKGHEWKTTVNSRSRGNSCPYCSNKRVLHGFNDLVITHPELAKEWHSIKNGNLKPTDVTYGSIKKVWWECKCGCSWLASIHTRTQGYGNCPNCKKNKKEKVALKVSPKIRITKDNKIKIV